MQKEFDSLTIIIPCFNEQDNLIECVKRIPTLPYETEIIAVDDGSRDNTLNEMKKINRKNFSFYSYEKNKGKGYALRHALQKSKNDVVIIQDCDMATMPEEIQKVIKPIFEDKADFVNTSRLNNSMEKNAMTFLRVIGNNYFALLVSLLTGFKFSDALSGFKAFKRKDFVNQIKENGWMDFELIFLAKKKKLRVVEIPIQYKKRTAGKSKMNDFIDFIKMNFMLLKCFFSRID